MRKSLILTTLICCFLAAAVFAWAQNRKAGLWEMTTTTAFPPSLERTPGIPAGPTPHTSMVCLTQPLLEKYGAPLPQTRGGCRVTSLDKKESSMTAELDCTGRVTGKINAESSWTADRAKGTVHFTGTVMNGASSRQVEWTATSVSVFKGEDCGSVKPYPMPDQGLFP